MREGGIATPFDHSAVPQCLESTAVLFTIMGLAYFVIVLFSNHYQTYITTATFISITARFYNRSCTYFFILKTLMIGYTTYQWWWNLKYIHRAADKNPLFWWDEK